MKHLKLTWAGIFLFFASVALNAQGWNVLRPVPWEKYDDGKARIVINADMGKETISRHIYGHFSEHLGRCIYGGYWVGENSDIPNTRGIRNDIVEALKATKIPNLRWPGGCFADEYHWMDGIGPRDQRPKMINTHWGGVTEDNSFGTHEFLDLCEQLETEPVICGNVGSGTVAEMSKWVEYVNFDGISPMADLRRQNGREEPWGVKFWGIGNETWGCGGRMTPEHYADLYRNYATYTRNYGDNRLMRICSGANSTDYHWTEVMMRDVGPRMMWGLSLHYYTRSSINRRASATQFGEDEYFDILERCLAIETAIDRHIDVMDRYDPEKRVALVVDEWGAWYAVEPGTNPGFLYQQNSLRDAILAGLSLNYFNAKADRVKMANIAQTVNVLQALILTDEAKMLLTPTYYVFEMYKVHQDATLLPLDLKTADYAFGGSSIPAISASASKDENGAIHISLVNMDPNKNISVEIELRGADTKSVSGRVLTASAFNAHNTFDNPEAVKPAEFNGARLRRNVLTVDMPSKSVVVLEVK